MARASLSLEWLKVPYAIGIFRCFFSNLTMIHNKHYI